MSLPYTPEMITRILRAMPTNSVRAAKPADFQMWPARVIQRGPLIRELISNELARRAS